MMYWYITVTSQRSEVRTAPNVYVRHPMGMSQGHPKMCHDDILVCIANYVMKSVTFTSLLCWGASPYRDGKGVIVPARGRESCSI